MRRGERRERKKKHRGSEGRKEIIQRPVGHAQMPNIRPIFLNLSPFLPASRLASVRGFPCPAHCHNALPKFTRCSSPDTTKEAVDAALGNMFTNSTGKRVAKSIQSKKERNGDKFGAFNNHEKLELLSCPPHSSLHLASPLPHIPCSSAFGLFRCGQRRLLGPMLKGVPRRGGRAWCPLPPAMLLPVRRRTLRYRPLLASALDRVQRASTMQTVSDAAPTVSGKKKSGEKDEEQASIGDQAARHKESITRSSFAPTDHRCVYTYLFVTGTACALKRSQLALYVSNLPSIGWKVRNDQKKAE